MIIFRNLTATLRTAAAAGLLSLALPLGALNPAPEPLITSEKQILTPTYGDGKIYDMNINVDKTYAWGRHISLESSESATITVDFADSPVELSKNRGLVVYFGRYENWGAPTVLKISGRVSGSTTYSDLGYAYLLFRGSNRAHEFSNRVYGLTENEVSYDSFKLEIIEVSSGKGISNSTTAEFFKFNLYAIADDEYYPGGRLDPLHAIGDYYLSYRDYKYQSNKGILSHRNHYGKNATYYCTGTGQEEMSTPWGENHTFVYDGEVYDLPTFDKQGDSQMPHITEMTLYAMPGDIITLIPFYDLPNVGNYYEKFSHWYGYIPKNSEGELQNQDYSFDHVKDSDGNVLLDFLADPSGIVKTDNVGYFGGSAFPRRNDPFVTIEGKEYYVIGNYLDLCEFAEYVYQSKDREYTNAILVSDIECNGSDLPTSIGANNPTLTGNTNVEYRGEFNGNGYAIKNLTITRDNDQYHTGLFGMVHDGCYIHDLKLLNVNVTSGGRAAGLIGMTWGDVKLENVLVTGNVKITATGNLGGNNVSYAAGILAYHNNGSLDFKNVGFVGTVTGGYDGGANAAFVAFCKTCNLDNCYSIATIDHLDGGNGIYSPADANVTMTNTYVDLNAAETDDEFNTRMLDTLIGDWTLSDGYVTPAMTTRSDFELDEAYLNSPLSSHPLRWYGTSATFYQPRKSKFAPDAPENLNLDIPAGADAFHIAADFAHEFNPTAEFNLDNENKTIHEPILAFRYIWHIKDGKKFADDYTTSVKDNETYLSQINRAVSARAGHDFQVRLNTIVPNKNSSGDPKYAYTNFYYKKADGSYGRVPRVGLEVYKLDDDGQVTGAPIENMFTFDATSTSQGTRKYQDVENGFGNDDPKINNGDYYTGDGNMSLYRVVYCSYEHATPGKYRVRLVALDHNGNSKITIGDSEDPLYIDEYIITFVGEDQASVINEKDLVKYTAEIVPGDGETNYYYHRAEYLEQEEVAGAPAVIVDFDQYRTFESEPYDPSLYFRHNGNTDSKHLSFKWPTTWQNSTYSFGYGGYYDYDYNEYIIANHSSQVTYHAAADNHKNPDNTTGLYDRLWYETYDAESNAGDMGYFYYVNAATDPGVIAKLQIHSLCPGSTVAVSAWAAEMSPNYATANIAFNFMAVDAQGNSEPVHTFVTGFIDNQKFGSATARQQHGNIDENHGDWMHIYYEFIPDLNSIQMKMIDHYELWLENNCVSSVGADYAVDDIRAYIISPQIIARQLEPVCDPEQTTVAMRITSRFDKLLSSNGLEETNVSNENSKIVLNFAVLDKKVYDEEYEEYQKKEYADDNAQNKALNEVVRKAIISMVEDADPNVDSQHYVAMDLYTFYEDLPEYDERTLNKAMRYTSETTGTRYFRANIQPFDKNLRPGKDYYIVLYPEYADVKPVDTLGLSAFAITGDACDKYAVMTLQGSGVIKIDGIAYNDGNPIEVCEGQSPVVQVDLKMLAEGKEIQAPNNYDDYVNAPNHYYDWFLGPIEDFMKKPDGDASSSLYDILFEFRNGDKDAGVESNIDATELPELPEGQTEDKYTPLRQLVADGRLVLHASSFVFPPIQGSADDEERILVLTAMPIIPGPDDEENYKVCSQPNEIRLRVADSAPRMLDGFDGIDYPEEDVPLRLGFRQLNSINDVADLTSNGGDNLVVNTTAVIPANAKYLELPLRGITSYKGVDSDATMGIGGNVNEEGDPFVYLVETNDPRYIGLDKHPMDKQAIKNGLLPIGMMQNMTAIKDGTANSVGIVFSKQMEFREGYYYRVRFNFDEVLNTEVDGYCQGQVVFTLKVVPEYMKWTGVDSRNWNNDANWSRVKAEELLLPDGDAKTSDHTIVDDKKRIALVENAMGVIETREVDVTGNAMSYAPLDFTKVIVPNLRGDENAKGYPWMFTASSENVTILNGSSLPWNNQAVSKENPEGIATENIEYDMTSLDMLETDDKLACRPWYANTCEEIHFNHGAELVHQESFVFEKNYQKAWVDMEMTGDRWYTLGSPLQGVVAGDMYTKTAGGKQDNELFTEINFNNTDYGRFEPAVYQRGWNKANTNTYKIDGRNEAYNTAVALNWSRVYNDVDEDYAPGTGFSIRTESMERWGEDKIVRFRLPKADDKYSYFDKGDYTEDLDDKTVSRPGNRHSLTDFTTGEFKPEVEVGTAGNYFLVGNPFIARMDMAKFLEVNSTAIAPYYWIMTDERQDATLWDEKSGTFISTELTEAVNGTIAPMQGFFVQAKAATKDLKLTFTPDMIVTGPIDSKLELKSVSMYDPQVISVSALDADGVVASRAIINIDPMAQAAYDGAEDAALLLDRTLDSRATVYTVASEQALAINSLGAIVETEVGLLAAADDVVSTLVFEGVDNAEGLLLLDTTTGQFTDLYDGMTVEVEGSASGRFYITRPTSGLTELTMAVVLKDRTVSIVAATEGIVARVYTPAGLSLGEWSVDDTSLQFDLEPGIFIVEAVADNQRVTRKFVVK